VEIMDKQVAKDTLNWVREVKSNKLVKEEVEL
jgi:hypothetical protein